MNLTITIMIVIAIRHSFKFRIVMSIFQVFAIVCIFLFS